MARRVLYLRGGRVRDNGGGADLVSWSVHKMLERYFGPESLEGFYLDQLAPMPGRLGVLAAAATGCFERYSGRVRELLAKRARGADLLFVDQSVYGLACGDGKNADPGLPCAALFHNAERRYYLHLAARTKRWASLALVPAIVRAERTAARRADLLIALSARDADDIEEDYGRRPELVLSPVLEDRLPASGARAPATGAPFTILFAGSAFPPNLEGVRWLATKVMPAVAGHLLVVGRDFEAYRAELESERVEVVGTVPDVTPYYAKAHCVASPIFWGSGIKVKTAEAFMQGKIVVGTDEALEGYDAEAAGAVRANDVQSFVEALDRIASERDSSGFSAKARGYYESELSFEYQYAKLRAALDIVLEGRERRS